MMRVHQILKTFACAICAVFLSLAYSPHAQAFEYEHYAWTYYLALHVGFTERQAYQIASATIQVDFDTDTNPMPYGKWDEMHILFGDADKKRFRDRWQKFHAFYDMDGYNSALSFTDDPTNIVENYRDIEQGQLWNIAIIDRNPGAFLHFVQDREPHGGWGDFVGHGPAGHTPDYFATSRTKALRMTEDTLKFLGEFKSEMCRSRPRGKYPYCRYKQINKARVSQVLDRMIQAQPVPGPLQSVKDIDGVLDGIKKMSLDIKHRGFTTRGNATLYSLLTTSFEYLWAGLPLGLPQNLIGSGAVEQPLNPYLEVVNQAVREDKASGVLNYFGENIPPLPNDMARRIYSAFELPSGWISYQFDPAGRQHILLKSIYELEEQSFQTGLMQGRVNFAELSGEGPDTLFRVTLDVPIQLKGTSDINAYTRQGLGQNFARSLPVIINSRVTGALSTSSTSGLDILFARDEKHGRSTLTQSATAQLIGNGKKVRFETKVNRKDLESGNVNWYIRFLPYGLDLQGRTINLRIEKQDVAVKSNTDQKYCSGLLVKWGRAWHKLSSGQKHRIGTNPQAIMAFGGELSDSALKLCSARCFNYPRSYCQKIEAAAARR